MLNTNCIKLIAQRSDYNVIKVLHKFNKSTYLKLANIVKFYESGYIRDIKSYNDIISYKVTDMKKVLFAVCNNPIFKDQFRNLLAKLELDNEDYIALVKHIIKADNVDFYFIAKKILQNNNNIASYIDDRIDIMDSAVKYQSHKIFGLIDEHLRDKFIIKRIAAACNENNFRKFKESILFPGEIKNVPFTAAIIDSDLRSTYIYIYILWGISLGVYYTSKLIKLPHFGKIAMFILFVAMIYMFFG